MAPGVIVSMTELVVVEARGARTGKGAGFAKVPEERRLKARMDIVVFMFWDLMELSVLGGKERATESTDNGCPDRLHILMDSSADVPPRGRSRKIGHGC